MFLSTKIMFRLLVSLFDINLDNPHYILFSLQLNLQIYFTWSVTPGICWCQLKVKNTLKGVFQYIFLDIFSINLSMKFQWPEISTDLHQQLFFVNIMFSVVFVEISKNSVKISEKWWTKWKTIFSANDFPARDAIN